MAHLDREGFCADPRHVRPSSSTRREVLYVGLIGGLGLTLGNYFGVQQAQAASKVASVGGQPSNEQIAKAKSIIHIFLPGGMSAHETFDPKPDAPLEYKGPLGTIKTKLDGEVFSEHLKQTAQIADQLTIVRSMTHGEAAHERGTHNMFTGYRPSPALKYPSFGSVISHEYGPRNNMPAYVAVPSMANEFAGSGYLSSAHGPFSLGSDPANGNFAVRDLALPNGIDESRFTQRRNLLETVDGHFKQLEKSDALDAMDEFYQRAYGLISSKAAREAFDLKAEADSVKDKYGRNSAGMRFLMARRLVEAGVRFVSTTFGGWDHHAQIAGALGRQLPQFDQAYAALITDLRDKGLLDSTLVMVTTEFGRTPKINKDAGRDHWPKVFSIAMAGGGIKKGQIYGSSDPTGAEPENNPLTVEDMSATIYNLLGIDPDKRLMAPGGRPIDIVRGGKTVEGLLA